MKRTVRSIAALAAVVATIGLAPLSASAFGDGCMPPTERHSKKMGEDLKLSDKQRQEIRDVCTKGHAQSEPMFKKMMEEKRALRALVHADTVDEAAIRAQSGKVAKIMADLEVQRAHTNQQVRALLTPEQVKQLKDIQAKRDSRVDARHHHRAEKRPHHGDHR